MISTEQNAQYESHNKDEKRLRVRQALMLPGWLCLACIAVLMILGTGDLLTSANGMDEKLIAGLFYGYMGLAGAIFLASWKGKHLPYIILSAYCLVMPLAFYYLILKWFDRRK